MAENDDSIYGGGQEVGFDDINEEMLSTSVHILNVNHSSSPPPNDESILHNFSLQGDVAVATASSSGLPLGLRMDITPELLNLVQKNVSEGKPKMDQAANIQVTSIQIGNWQRFSSRKGDLTAKIFYAKRTFIWEILEGALKYKMEIPWSHIIDIRAVMPYYQDAILQLELKQPPSYFREVGPVPKKRTVWEEIPDFIGAPNWRKHFLSFKFGILDEHFNKVLQYDERLFDLCQKHFF